MNLVEGEGIVAEELSALVQELGPGGSVLAVAADRRSLAKAGLPLMRHLGDHRLALIRGVARDHEGFGEPEGGGAGLELHGRRLFPDALRPLWLRALKSRRWPNRVEGAGTADREGDLEKREFRVSSARAVLAVRRMLRA